MGSDFASGGRFGVPPRWGNGFPAAFTSAGTSSFTDFLTGYSPGLLPGGGPGLAAAGGTGGALDDLPHGTTIVAAACQHGVVMAGDRRATSGSMIAQRDIEKVFRSDEFSCVGIAGVAGIGIELVRLFQVELEHYEKLEGRALSVEGKANRLAAMVRGNLGAALQGLIVVPLFAGYDDEKGIGRIFSYTPDGGRYEEHRYQSIGSGSIFAKGALKKLYYEDMAVPDAILACVQALYDAADDDSATGGPDLARRIFPVIVTVTDEGFRRLTDAESGEYAQNVVEARMRAPDGPHAPLRGQAERAEIERG